MITETDIMKWRGLVKCTVNLLLKRWSDDAEQQGLIGVWEALRTFDPTRGRSMKSWVLLKIRSHIIDWIRNERSWYYNEPVRPHKIKKPNHSMVKPRINLFTGSHGHEVCIVNQFGKRVRKGSREEYRKDFLSMFPEDLTDREKVTMQIIVEYLDGYTLQDLGDRYGYTREAIRQRMYQFVRKYVKDLDLAA